ncbi:MAG: ABC transporter ATP-binding protein [Coriobacteriia bacterium]|nr:ABC transporter ATP-binding protein [Coriobacteriia bacterium]MBS5477527.1 ABC transporter ATP-binding protein [Coriobacteriia bacterium]
MILAAEHVDCGYKGQAILHDVDLTFKSGEVVCLLGPNGVGKTTMFKTMLGFLAPVKGRITIDGKPRSEFTRKQFAQLVAYVPQLHEPPFPFSVLDVVLAGCASRLGPLATPSKEDYAKAEATLDELGVSYLRDMTFTEISGGEQQMTLVARALVQDPKMLVMDEPTAALDFGNQVRVLSCVRRLAAEQGRGVIMTSHNPDHAFLCCSRAVLIKRDRTLIDGPVDDVVTEENLRAAYGIRVRITQATGDDGMPIKTCVPLL